VTFDAFDDAQFAYARAYAVWRRAGIAHRQAAASANAIGCCVSSVDAAHVPDHTALATTERDALLELRAAEHHLLALTRRRHATRVRKELR
jgi:hypothetical protein